MSSGRLFNVVLLYLNHGINCLKLNNCNI